MGSSSGQTPTTQTQNASPWEGVQPQLRDLYTRAGELTGAKQGYGVFPGDLQAPLDPTVQQGLGLEGGLANYLSGQTATGGVNAARGLGTDMINRQGLSDNLMGTAGLLNMANYNAGNVYNEASGQQNPYLLSQIAANDRRIADKVNSSVSGAGRYGSGAHTDVLGRSMAEAADPILAQDYAQRQQTRLAALQGQQQAAGSLANLYQTGQETAGKWAQLMPGLNEAMYQPAKHLQAVGDVYQQRSAQDVANQVAKYNAEQAHEWENLQRFAGILSGAGALGGTKVSTTTAAQPSTLQKLLGGGLAGAGAGSIFGAPGAAIGGVGGGLLSLL